MKYFLTIIVMLLTLSIYSQNKISGKISDKETNEALTGVNIYFPELQKGTISDENGNFNLQNLPNGQFKLRFSFIGYGTIIKTINLTGTPIVLDINLESQVIHSQEVVISGGSYSTQHENAIKIELIKADDILKTGSPSFIEAISKIPGVDLISKGVGINTPVIRGLSTSNILMLNNGIRMENFQFSENHPFTIDEFGVSAVEIIKGPASLLYGSDAVGGVINVIKEKPAAEGKIKADFNTKYFSNTNGVVSNLGINANHNGFFWGLRAGIKSHEDYKAANEIIVKNSRFNENSLKLNAGINKVFGKFSIYYDYNQMNLGLTLPQSITLIENNERKNDVWYQNLTNNLISSKNSIFFKKFKAEINLSYQNNIRKLIGSDFTPVKELVNMELNTFTSEIKAFLPISDRNEIILGMQALNQNNTNGNAPEHVLPNYDLNDFSAFGLFQSKINGHFYFQAGLRYDYRIIDVPQQNESNSTDSHILEALNKTYENISGSVGLTINVTNDLLFRANFSSAYRSPNIAELTQDGMHGARFEQGNENLESQRSFEYDLSMHYHSKFVAFDLSGFYNQINNYIFLAPTTEISDEGSQIYRYSQNNASIYGFETGIELKPFNFMSFTTTYSYLLGQQQNGDYLPFIPQNKIKSDVKFEAESISIFKNPYFTISNVYAFEQSNPAMFETNTDAYYLLNSSIGFNLKIKNQDLFFDVFINNILDNEYVDHLSTLKPMNLNNIGRNIGISLKIPVKIR
ncbi:MAG: TonB-dependent receptor [Bacteroidales bacterium]|nr:TonB-dependent receptor [Bacteroidales bacterium]MBN2757130.1 TonB-dependent receptor [Bacteroidales bacterium]